MLKKTSFDFLCKVQNRLEMVGSFILICFPDAGKASPQVCILSSFLFCNLKEVNKAYGCGQFILLVQEVIWY